MDGKRLVTYKVVFTMPTVEYSGYATVTTVDADVYFAGRLIGQGAGTSFATTPTDNIASTRSGPNTTNGLIVPSSFFPWGEEQTSTTNDRLKFATTRRDSESNLDYAWNRYYNNATARFMSPDPSSGSTSPSTPQSWNKYSYVLNDPIGANDPTGQEVCWIDGYFSDEGWNPGQWASVPGNCPGFTQFYATGFGGGGGGGVFRITVTGYSRTGQKEDTIAADLNTILDQVLNGSCAKWLTGPKFSASDFIKAIIGSGPSTYSFGYGNLNDNLIAAFVGNLNANKTPIAGLPIDATITVNANGAFFSPAYTVGSGNTQFAGGTLQAQLFVLVHELAHEVSAAGFEPGAGNQANENSNNALVQENCGKQIASAN